MMRSTKQEKSQRLNKAFELLGQHIAANQAANALAKQFGISLRQAYRYLQEAQRIGKLVPVAEPTIPITIKIPRDVVLKLRAYAQTSDLTMGDIVGRAVLSFLTREDYHG
jgi:hypothetical protein